MKASVPESAKISKDAKECMQECVSEFISFITSEAVERCNIEKRKTINGEDILYALQSLGFESHSAVLRIYLSKLRVRGISRPVYHGYLNVVFYPLQSSVADEMEKGKDEMGGDKPPRKKAKRVGLKP